MHQKGALISHMTGGRGHTESGLWRLVHSEVGVIGVRRQAPPPQPHRAATSRAPHSTGPQAPRGARGEEEAPDVETPVRVFVEGEEAPE